MRNKSLQKHTDQSLRSAWQRNRNSQLGFDNGNLVLCCLDLFLAGSETTSKTLQWGLIYLINSPHIQGGCSDKSPTARNRLNSTRERAWCRSNGDFDWLVQNLFMTPPRQSAGRDRQSDRTDPPAHYGWQTQPVLHWRCHPWDPEDGQHCSSKWTQNGHQGHDTGRFLHTQGASTYSRIHYVLKRSRYVMLSSLCCLKHVNVGKVT